MTPLGKIDSLIQKLIALYPILSVTMVCPEYNSFHKELAEFIFYNNLDSSAEWRAIEENLIYRTKDYFDRYAADSILENLQKLRYIVLKNTGQNPTKKYDVFVSHASANKANFVNNLISDIERVTSNIWYDAKKIRWGNDLLVKINDGLVNCEFGIVVFSKDFFGRAWTEYELEQLLNKQNEGKMDVVLPILYECTPQEFIGRYPKLSNIKFIEKKDHDTKDIAIMFAERLIERLRESIQHNSGSQHEHSKISSTLSSTPNTPNLSDIEKEHLKKWATATSDSTVFWPSGSMQIDFPEHELILENARQYTEFEGFFDQLKKYGFITKTTRRTGDFYTLTLEGYRYADSIA